MNRHHRIRILFFTALSVLASHGCGGSPPAATSLREEIPEKTVSRCCPGPSFKSKATAYYPSPSRMEGGHHDRLGKPLHTLQDFLAGKADYVSVAMDSKAFVYGKRLCIPSIEEKYSRSISFRVVDTGGAFKGKGKTRIDICVANAKAAVEKEVNGSVVIVACD